MSVPEYFFVREDRQYLKIITAEVLYLTAYKNYTKIVTSKRSYMVLSTLHRFEGFLAGSQFCRIHRSHIINLSHMSAFDTGFVVVGGVKVSIGESYFASLQERLYLFGGQLQTRIRSDNTSKTAVLV
ncbi:MAG TPA: LytTR family DNA-binding domain-containing protein [Puia sp.]|jgi:DNA-binding LytR/AlgR family response regulator